MAEVRVRKKRVAAADTATVHPPRPQQQQPNGRNATRVMAVGAVLLGTSAAVAAMVDRHLGRAPYMDELFHVRQTQRYCAGHFWLWDPMITTFPGLYVIFHLLFGVADGVNQMLGYDSDDMPPFHLCSVPVMRGMNLLFGFLNIFLFYALIDLLYFSKTSTMKRTWSPLYTGSTLHILMSLLPYLFPLQFFFYFLYYTDTVSTFFVFLCYYLSLKGRLTLSGLVGCIAVACRQTNIVWMCFVAFSDVLTQYRLQLAHEQDETLADFLIYVTNNIRAIFARLWIFIVTAISFLLFLYINEGIVIGDRTQHNPRLHFPQLFYFMTFAVAWLWPRIGLSLMSTIQVRGWPIVKRGTVHFLAGTTIALPIIIYLIHHYTYAHPYLLADNRHYPFYVWKNFFKRNEDLKYLYSLLYYLAGFSIWKLLGANVSPLWRLVYFVSTALVLVPASLLEFRYFIIPFLFLLLHTMPLPNQLDQKSKTPSSDLSFRSVICLGTELILFSAVNMLTFYIFLHRPFTWPSGEVARIMW